MKQYNFSIGYNGNIEDLSKIIASSDNVLSVYTGGIKGIIAGGRPQYSTELESLKEQIQYAHKHNLAYEIALNTPCGFKEKSDKVWWNKVKKYLKTLEEIEVDYIIASHPFLIELVKTYSTMKVVLSTICEVSNVRSALYYEKMGVDIIVPSMNINYDLDTLRLMKNTLKTARIRLMVNEHCLGDCPWRRFHHSHYAHSDVEIDYHYNCKLMYLKEPFLLLTNNCIRPEDLKQYHDITTDFKIVGRLAPIDDLVKRIRIYTEGDYIGNYVSLFDSLLAKKIQIPNKALDGLFNKKITCKKICQTCNYCQLLYKNINNYDTCHKRELLWT